MTPAPGTTPRGPARVEPANGERLSQVAELTEALGTAQDSDQAAAIVLDWLFENVPAGFAAVFLSEAGAAELRLAAAQGAPLPYRTGLPVGDDPWAWLQARGVPVPPEADQRQVISIASGAQSAGLICLLYPDQAPWPTQRRLAQVAAGCLGLSLRNLSAEQREELPSSPLWIAVADRALRQALEERLHAEVERAESEERFRLFVETVSDYAMVMLDPLGRVVSWNAGAERIKGYQAEDVLGEHFSCFYVPESAAAGAPERALHEAAETGRHRDEGWRVRPDNSRYWADVTITALRDSSGRLRGFAKITRDITERRAAEAALAASEARYRALFENMLDAFARHRLIVDEAGRPLDFEVLEVNQAFETFTGLPREAVVGQRITTVLPTIAQTDFDWIGTFGRVALEGERVQFEQFLGPLNRWFSVSAYSIEQGYFVTLFHDITQRKLAEQVLSRLNTELERRVAERTAELQAANRELEAFSYSVSHDLRAPLRSIDGFSQALLEDYGERLDSVGHEYLQRVRASAQRMGMLIDDLLELSRVTRAEMRRERVDLSALAESVVAELRRAEPERQVEIRVQPGLEAQGDARLLRLVLDNLLDNAWKFTARQPEAGIEFGAAETPDGRAYFVRDNGAGFDLAYANKLFVPFQRLHTLEEFPGTGVGLATVQRIIQRHGGRVWAEARVGQGATFYFTLEQPSA